jgi:hypothetical protein
VSSDGVKVDTSAVIGVKEEAANGALRFYPNPAKEELNVEVIGKTDAQITDILGRTMDVKRSRKILNEREVIRFDTEELSPGIYFIRTENSGKYNYWRFMKE